MLGFLKKFLKRDVSIKVKEIPSNEIRLNQWRGSQNLRAASAELDRNKTFQMAIQVLKTEHPCHLVFASIGVSANDRVAHQAKVEGYELCLNNLEAMKKPLKITERLESTFEPPQEKKK